jgi:peptidyl-prolyl cis-trans isomerase C
VFPTDEEAEKAARDMRANFQSIEAFRSAIAQQGLNEEEFDVRMVEDMAVRRYLSNVVPDTVAVDPEDARAFYDQHPEQFEVGEKLRASHILVGTSQMDPERARARADSLLAEIRDGAVFEDVARANSDCPSAQRGGSLSEFGRGQMVPSFEEAAYKLESGQVSDVVETRFGFHIIRLEERIPPRTIPFEDVKDRIAQQVRANRYTERLHGHIEELRSQASIERKL